MWDQILISIHMSYCVQKQKSLKLINIKKFKK